jgi:hypothetical protein
VTRGAPTPSTSNDTKHCGQRHCSAKGYPAAGGSPATL